MLSGLFNRPAASAADFTHLRQARVELRNVIKHYDNHTVLNGVSLSVEPGEVVTILGPSGSGKSTLIRLINQLESLSGGDAYAAQLSGGQQQRVAIARALASSPQIILFDEPTSALDPEMIGEVLQVMKRLAHSGITMIVVTHEMHFAREIADRVVFIDGGDILEVAPPEAFFTRPQHPRTQRFLKKVLDPLHQESSL